MNLLFNSDIVNLLLKTNVGTKGLMLLFWSALIVDGRAVRLGRWEGGRVGKVRGSWFYSRVEDAE